MATRNSEEDRRDMGSSAAWLRTMLCVGQIARLYLSVYALPSSQARPRGHIDCSAAHSVLTPLALLYMPRAASKGTTLFAAPSPGHVRQTSSPDADKTLRFEEPALPRPARAEPGQRLRTLPGPVVAVLEEAWKKRACCGGVAGDMPLTLI